MNPLARTVVVLVVGIVDPREQRRDFIFIHVVVVGGVGTAVGGRRPRGRRQAFGAVARPPSPSGSGLPLPSGGGARPWLSSSPPTTRRLVARGDARCAGDRGASRATDRPDHNGLAATAFPSARPRRRSVERGASVGDGAGDGDSVSWPPEVSESCGASDSERGCSADGGSGLPTAADERGRRPLP